MTKKEKKGEGGKSITFTIGLIGKHKLDSKWCMRTSTIQREKLR